MPWHKEEVRGVMNPPNSGTPKNRNKYTKQLMWRARMSKI